MTENDLFYRMDMIHQDIVYPLLERLMETYEAIDTLILNVTDDSDDEYRHLHTSGLHWSAACKLSCMQLEYCLKRCSHVKRKHLNIRQLIVL